jgi:hypothetical protein
MTDEYRPRFTFEITEEQQARATRLLSTFGIRKAVMTVVLEDLLNLIDSHGQVIIGVLLDGAAKPREILPTLAKAERKARE